MKYKWLTMNPGSVTFLQRHPIRDPLYLCFVPESSDENIKIKCYNNLNLKLSSSLGQAVAV